MWEYKFVIISFHDGDAIEESERSLNSEGADGWEAVAVTPKSAVLPKMAGADGIVLMKRPKQPEVAITPNVEALKDVLDSLEKQPPPS